MSPERESWRRLLANIRNNMPRGAYERLLLDIAEDVEAERRDPGTIPMPPPTDSQEST